MIIYKTTNLINRKIYIGRDSQNDKHYLGSGKIFLRALKKYSKENFKKEIIDEADNIELLNEKERYWIKKLDAQNPKIGYNISDGGTGGNNIVWTPQKRKWVGDRFRGIKHTRKWKKEHSKKMKECPSFKNKHHNDMTKKMLSKQRKKWWKTKGKLLTDEEKSKLYGHQKNIGRICSEQQKIKQSKAMTKYIFYISKDDIKLFGVWGKLKEIAQKSRLSYSYLRSMFTTRYQEGITYRGWILNKEIINGHNS